MLPSKSDLPYYYAEALRRLNRTVEARVLLSRFTAMLEEKLELPSIGWEDMISSFNPFVNNPQDQREGTAYYQLGMFQKYAGNDDRAHELFEKSKALWPENINTWMELDFC